MSTKFYTPKTVSGILNVTDVCLCLWRRDGFGPPWEKPGHRIRYPVDQFKEYLAAVGTLPAADASAHEKGKFFKRAHKASDPGPGTIEELAARLAAVEKALVKLRVDRPKPKRRTARLGGRASVVLAKRHKRKSKELRARQPKRPTPDAIPY